MFTSFALTYFGQKFSSAEAAEASASAAAVHTSSAAAIYYYTYCLKIERIVEQSTTLFESSKVKLCTTVCGADEQEEDEYIFRRSVIFNLLRSGCCHRRIFSSFIVCLLTLPHLTSSILLSGWEVKHQTMGNSFERMGMWAN